MEAAFTGLLCRIVCFHRFAAGDFLGKSYFANLYGLRAQLLSRVVEELEDVNTQLSVAHQTAAESAMLIEELSQIAVRSHDSRTIGVKQVRLQRHDIAAKLYAQVDDWWLDFVVNEIDKTVDGFNTAPDKKVSKNEWKQLEREIGDAVKIVVERVRFAFLMQYLF